MGNSSHNESSQCIKVRPDSYVLPKTDSRNKNGQKWLFNKNSSALVSDTATNSTINDCRSKSNLKKRRTRREREASIENSTNQNESKHPNDKVKIENNDYVVFNENEKSLNYMRIKDRNSRTAICSIERNNLNNESFMSQINTKAQNIDKNAQLIAKKTFEALAKVRPTQSTVRCIRFLVLVLKCFNNKLTSISEYGTWTVLLCSILSNLGVILKEIKLLSKRCSALETAPQIIDEMNSRLFINTDKSLPSCSKAFQKECKPIANLLQSIICYYEIKDKSIDDRSNNSAIFQSNDQSYQNIVNNQSTHMKTLSNFDMDQVENTKTRLNRNASQECFLKIKDSGDKSTSFILCNENKYKKKSRLSTSKSFLNELERSTNNQSAFEPYHPKEVFMINKSEDSATSNKLVETPRVKLTKCLIDKNKRW